MILSEYHEKALQAIRNMTETLWTKYMGKSPSMETIYRDDYIPLVKKFLGDGKPIEESLFEALTAIGCQLPFGIIAPLGWVSKARAAIFSGFMSSEIFRDDRET